MQEELEELELLNELELLEELELDSLEALLGLELDWLDTEELDEELRSSIDRMTKRS